VYYTTTRPTSWLQDEDDVGTRQQQQQQTILQRLKVATSDTLY